MGRLIIAITGATGAIYGVELLKILKSVPDWESYLILTDSAKITIKEELNIDCNEIQKLADMVLDNRDVGACIASGSFLTEGMVIAPCSMKTLSGIANGYAENLVIRAADVCLKEQRRLVLMVRETPLNAIHLENMLKLARLGVVILPPIPAFYTQPKTIEHVINHSLGKILDLFSIKHSLYPRWEGARMKK